MGARGSFTALGVGEHVLLAWWAVRMQRFHPHPSCRHVVAGPAACDVKGAAPRQHAFLLLSSHSLPCLRTCLLGCDAGRIYI